MATLTNTVSARVDKKTLRRIDREVRNRRKQNPRVNSAEITREALVEYFDKRDLAKAGRG